MAFVWIARRQIAAEAGRDRKDAAGGPGARVIEITYQIASGFPHTTISGATPGAVAGEPEDHVNSSLTPAGAASYRSEKAIPGKEANAIRGRAGPY